VVAGGVFNTGVTIVFFAVPLTFTTPFILTTYDCAWLGSAGADGNTGGTAADIPSSAPPAYGPNGVTQTTEGELLGVKVCIPSGAGNIGVSVRKGLASIIVASFSTTEAGC